MPQASYVAPVAPPPPWFHLSPRIQVTTPIPFHNLRPSHRASYAPPLFILPNYLTLPHVLVCHDRTIHMFLPQHTPLDTHIPISLWALVRL